MDKTVHIENEDLEEVASRENLKELKVIGLTNTGNHRFEVTHNGECFSIDFFNIVDTDENYDISALSNGSFIDTVNAAKEYTQAPVDVRME